MKIKWAEFLFVCICVFMFAQGVVLSISRELYRVLGVRIRRVKYLFVCGHVRVCVCLLKVTQVVAREGEHVMEV